MDYTAIEEKINYIIDNIDKSLKLNIKKYIIQGKEPSILVIISENENDNIYLHEYGIEDILDEAKNLVENKKEKLSIAIKIALEHLVSDALNGIE